MSITIGDYLIQRLIEAGCDTVFGVPGDFVLGFFDRLIDPKNRIKYVGTCNELNAAYAADGYARIKGLGCVATTYSVGELSALNGVAGSFAENVPVVVITGTPKTIDFNQQPLLHHTLGDYRIPMKIFSYVTGKQIFLSDPNRAAKQIDEILTFCLQEKTPVYIGLPSDITNVKLPNINVEAILPFSMPLPRISDPDTLRECMKEIEEKIKTSILPIAVPGLELKRRKLEKEFEKFIDASGFPFCTMMLSKAIVDENHDLFVGLYLGERSRPEVKERVKMSDCVLIFGEKMSDLNTGGFSLIMNPQAVIYIGAHFVRVSQHIYHGIYIHDVLEELIKISPPLKKADILKARPAKIACTHRPSLELDMLAGKDPLLTMDRLFQMLCVFWKPRGVLIAETGSALFSSAETMLPPDFLFLGQTFYGSIGYTVGATLGVCMATDSKNADRDVTLIIGDGSLQVTMQDISTLIRQQLSPLILVINNGGYTIERVIHDGAYNDIQPWHYSRIPLLFGGREGFVVHTEGELRNALSQVSEWKTRHDLCVIEIILDKMDCNEILKMAGASLAISNNIKPPSSSE